MNVKQFVSMLGKASRYGWANQRGAVADLSVEFQQAQEENFNRAEDSSGTPWKEHAPMTIALHGPHPLLILTGAMKTAAMGGRGSSFSIKAGPRKTTCVVSISKNAIPYAWKHQHGAGRIPRRQFFYMPKTARPRLVANFRKRVIAKVKKDLKWR